MNQRKPCIAITVEAVPGSDVYRAISEAIGVARRVWCNVETTFNGINLYMTPNSAVDDIVSEYQNGFGTWRDENRAEKLDAESRLREAAPDLLAACEAAEPHIDDDHWAIKQMLRDAIAKAKP